MRVMCAVMAIVIACSTPAFAQWAVIDPTNLVQNIEQVRQTLEQIQQMKQQLEAAERQLDTLTGSRGMRGLTTDTSRGYIPTEWNQPLSAMGPEGRELQRMIDDIRRNLGDIGGTRLGTAPPHVAETMEQSAQRDLQAYGRAATLYNRANDRFEELDKLGDALTGASDTKAVLDLIARLQIENNMLLNEMLRVQAEMMATDRQRRLFHDQRVQNQHTKAMSSF